jgi:hypothetical protein
MDIHADIECNCSKPCLYIIDIRGGFGELFVAAKAGD